MMDNKTCRVDILGCVVGRRRIFDHPTADTGAV